MAAPPISEIVATTIELRSGEIADNITLNNALLTKLNMKNKDGSSGYKPFTGGRVIFEELSWQENQTFQWYNGYDYLKIQPSNVLTAAQYNLKQASAAVTISGREEMQNASDEEEIDLIDERVTAAIGTMENKISAGLMSDGTDPLTINGLVQQVAVNPTTGMVGGFNRADPEQMFWRNQSFGGMTDSNLESRMRNAYTATVRGKDHSDLILTDDTTFDLYWGSLREDKRFTDKKMADGGFDNFKFRGAPVIHDEQCPAGQMFFLNCKYIKYRPHVKRNMVPSRKRDSINQDASIVHIFWAGNLTMKNANLQAVVHRG